MTLSEFPPLNSSSTITQIHTVTQNSTLTKIVTTTEIAKAVTFDPLPFLLLGVLIMIHWFVLLKLCEEK